MEKYQEIDRRVQPILQAMETRGIPFFEKRLIRRLHKFRKSLALRKQEINRDVGFVVDLESAVDRERAIQGLLAKKASHLPDEDQCEAEEFFASQVEEACQISEQIRHISRIHTMATANKGMGKGFAVYPCYRIGDMGRVETYGEVTLQEIPCSLRRMVGETGHILLKASYDRLEMSVLQGLSRDQTLAVDLWGDQHRNLASRLFGEERVSPHSREVARWINKVCMAGGGPEELARMLGEFRRMDYPLEHFCLEKAEIFHIQWRNCYRKCAEFLDELAKAGRKSEYISSFFGRKCKVLDDTRLDSRREWVALEDRPAVQFPIRSTATDLAKSGFADLYEDYRFQHLMKRGSVLAMLSRSIIVMVECGVDTEDLVEILTENLTNANPNFHLGVRIKVGTCLGQLI